VRPESGSWRWMVGLRARDAGVVVDGGVGVEEEESDQMVCV